MRPQLIRIELAKDQDFVPKAIAYGDAPCTPVLDDRGLTVRGKPGSTQFRTRGGGHYLFNKGWP